MVNGIPFVEDHDAIISARFQCALIAGKEVMDVLRARVDILQVGTTLGKESARPRANHAGMRSDKMRCLVSRLQESLLAGANIHLVPARGPVKQRAIVLRAVDILQRTRKILLDEVAVGGIRPGFGKKAGTCVRIAAAQRGFGKCVVQLIPYTNNSPRLSMNS